MIYIFAFVSIVFFLFVLIGKQNTGDAWGMAAHKLLLGFLLIFVAYILVFGLPGCVKG
jgi:hypothetical protein